MAVTVIVKFDYEARSGDELNLRKGDFISNVQQIASGGWWKGTLEGKTGMFPENFVTALSEQESNRLKANRTSANHRQDNEDATQNNVAQIAAKIGNKIDAPMRGEPSLKNRKKAKVVYSYTAQNDDEINLEAGAIVIVDQLIEDGWYSGTCNGKKGCFPSNFIEFIKDDLDMESDKGQVQAKKVQGVGLGNIFDGQSMNLKTGDPSEAQIEPKSGKAKSASARKRDEKALVTHDYTADAEDELSLTCGETIVILSRFAGDNGWWKGMVPSTRKVGVFPENFVKILPPDDMDDRMTYNDGNPDYDNMKVKGKPLPPVAKSQQQPPLPQSKKNSMEPHSRSSKTPNSSKSNAYPSPLPPKKHSKDPKHDDLLGNEYRSKESYGGSEQMQQMEASILNTLTEEITNLRVTMNQRIEALTDEFDEEKKVRVTMQVEIDRLRRLLRQ